jgi:hypothetical protein
VTGNPDLGFSSRDGYSFFNVGLTALFGYRVTDRLAIGPGMTYQYSSIDGKGYSNLGGRIFAQGIITESIFLHAEHEALRAEVPVIVFDPVTRQNVLSTFRTNVQSTFAGPGYRQRMGSRAAFDIVLLYNFNRAENFFLYNQPEFRFNLLFDLF